MDGTFLPMAVHEEYAKRMDAEHSRQNKRISDLEEKVEDIGELTASVASLAKSVEQMAKAQEKQGQRLDALEQKPAKRWENLVEKVIWSVAAAALTYALTQIGF